VYESSQTLAKFESIWENVRVSESEGEFGRVSESLKDCGRF
jgi:hypothetical protein